MADNAIQAPEEASAETQEILKELEAEGQKVAEKEPEVVTPKEETPVEPEKAPEAAPEPEKPKAPEREQKYVPVQKFNEIRHKFRESERKGEESEQRLQELEAKIIELSNKPSGQELDDVKAIATELAEKHNLEAGFVTDFAEKIVSIATKRNVLPKDIEQKLASFEQANAAVEAKAAELAQEKGFQAEFVDVLKEFPDLADRKEELKQLAFSEGNVNTSLRRLALEFVHDNLKPGRKTAESPLQGKKSVDEVVDFENITEEELAALDGEKLDMYLSWVDKVKRGRK